MVALDVVARPRAGRRPADDGRVETRRGRALLIGTAATTADNVVAMLELSPQLLTILVLVAVALAVLALVFQAASNPRSRRRMAPEPDSASLLAGHDQALQDLRGAVAALADEQRRQAEALLGFIQRAGLVRFDAFDDMGGQLSFSAALLDAHGDGVVITSINGRQDTRCYAKPVSGATSQHNLSVEEQQAIEQAMAGPNPALTPTEAPAGGARRVRRGV
jgi:hypothetical protein